MPLLEQYVKKKLYYKTISHKCKHLNNILNYTIKWFMGKICHAKLYLIPGIQEQFNIKKKKKATKEATPHSDPNRHRKSA